MPITIIMLNFFVDVDVGSCRLYFHLFYGLTQNASIYVSSTSIVSFILFIISIINYHIIFFFKMRIHTYIF